MDKQDYEIVEGLPHLRSMESIEERFVQVAAEWLAFFGHSFEIARYGTIQLTSPGAEIARQYFWGQTSMPEDNHFRTILDRAAEEKKGVVLTTSTRKEGEEKSKCIHISYPLFSGNTSENDSRVALIGAFELYPSGEQQLHGCMQQLQWGLKWLFNYELQKSTQEQSKNRKETLDQFNTASTIINSTLLSVDADSAAQTLLDSLSQLLGCERVSLGIFEKDKIRIHSVSGKYSTKSNSGFIKALANAQEEAIFQEKTVLLPDGDTPVITRAHAEIEAKFGSTSILTVPFKKNDNRNAGAITFEHDSKAVFTPDTVSFLEKFSQCTGPIVHYKYQSERPLYQLMGKRFQKQLHLFDPTTNLQRKAVSLLLACCLLFLCFARGDFIVTAEVTLSGTIQRALVAPFQGFVATAYSRAGDRVRGDDLLAALDTSDLALEQFRWSSKKNESDLEYRKAVADNITASAQIIQEQKRQAEIQLSLLELQKTRAEIKAPFSGLIVKGDLSQSIGSPVERGQILFELVPDDGFRVLAQVDEKDIGFVEENMKGSLVLNSLPRLTFSFTVNKITSVSKAADGKNSFRVEGALENAKTKSLRPGMKGYAKIITGRKPLLWIWTRKIRDRLRIWTWLVLG